MQSQKSRLQELEEFRKTSTSEHCCKISPDSSAQLSDDDSGLEDYENSSDDETKSRYLLCTIFFLI